MRFERPSDDPDSSLSGEVPGADLGHAVADRINELAGRQDGPTTLREFELDGQKWPLTSIRFRAAVERGKLEVMHAAEFSKEHPAKAAAIGVIGVIALGVALAQTHKFYVGQSGKSSARKRPAKHQK